MTEHKEHHHKFTNIVEGCDIEEILCSGQEISHMMLKPELLLWILEGRLLLTEFDTYLDNFCAANNLMKTPCHLLRLTPEETNLIYEKEIAKGVVIADVYKSIVSNYTGHIFISGPNANIKILAFKGRVNCGGIDSCYMKYGGEVNKQVVEVNPDGCNGNKRVWGNGCGMRLRFVKSGLLLPDPIYKNDTPFNGLHCSNPTDVYVKKLIQDNAIPSWVTRKIDSVSEIERIDLPTRYWLSR